MVVGLQLGLRRVRRLDGISKRSLAVKVLDWCAKPGSVPRNRASTTPKESSPAIVPIASFGIIAAMSKNHVIGVNGRLPWNLRSDRRAFKAATADSVLVLGRRTFDEEANRCHITHAAHSIVVSKTLAEDYSIPEASIRVARSFPKALDIARELCADGELECWVAGGEKLYHEALLHPSASTLLLTIVDTEIDVTDKSHVARFPAKYRWDNKFRLVSSEPGEENGLSFTRNRYERLKGLR